jgi:hypothetical protein
MLGLNFTSRNERYDILNTIILSHKDSKLMFIILYKYYVPKTSELKTQLPKLRFEI